MTDFATKLKTLDNVDHIAIMRVFGNANELLAIIPNLPGKQGSLRVYNHIARQGLIDIEAAQAGIAIFSEHALDAQQNPGKHPNIDLLVALQSRQSLRVDCVQTHSSQLLPELAKGGASSTLTEEFIELLNQGSLRAAEKVAGQWQPQSYVIDGILSYFSSHDNQLLAGNYWDKVPLKTANYSQQDFTNSGVRYAPGSIVRTGSYIGPQTVIMNMAFVNIGAYIAGEGVMIDGACRVASCAQIGKNVKFGAGSGIEGVLEPAGRLPSIIEDNAKIGAMCEVSGIVGEGAVLASGVIMASGKKVFDEATGEVVPPIECVVGEQTFLLPSIPPHRLAVGGSLLNSNGRTATDAIILKPGDLRDTGTLAHFEKQGILYQ